MTSTNVMWFAAGVAATWAFHRYIKPLPRSNGNGK